MNEQIEKYFTYQPPIAGNLPKFTKIRDKAKELAYILDENCPASSEKSKSLDKLREVVMWANASIIVNKE